MKCASFSPSIRGIYLFWDYVEVPYISSMNWIYFAVATVLVGFLLEIALRYRRESALARSKQEEMRLNIEKIKGSIAKGQARIDVTQGNINSLKEEKEQLARELKEATAELEKMEVKEKRRRPGHLAVDKDQADI